MLATVRTGDWAFHYQRLSGARDVAATVPFEELAWRQWQVVQLAYAIRFDTYIDRFAFT